MTTTTIDAPACTEAAALLHAVADPARLAVLRRLAGSPACVCTLQDEVPVTLNLLSYHLKVLREAGLITGSRRGRWIDYALPPGALERLHAAIPAPPDSPRKLLSDIDDATGTGLRAPANCSPRLP